MSPHLSFEPASRTCTSCWTTSSWSTRLQAASVVAVMAAVVGWFMVLRRETFAGHTLSMMSFPGAAAAALAGLPLAVGYFAFCGVGRGHRSPARARCGGPARAGAALGRDRGRGRGGAGARLPAAEPLRRRAREPRVAAVRLDPGRHARSGADALRSWRWACSRSWPWPGARCSSRRWTGRSPAPAGCPCGRSPSPFCSCSGSRSRATAQLTGVLLVFALLVAPAGIARELTPRIGAEPRAERADRAADRVGGAGSVLLHELLAGLLRDARSRSCCSRWRELERVCPRPAPAGARSRRARWSR